MPAENARERARGARATHLQKRAPQKHAPIAGKNETSGAHGQSCKNTLQNGNTAQLQFLPERCLA
eukprot:3539247-Lingulodinium_polyedra.AAC.1